MTNEKKQQEKPMNLYQKLIEIRKSVPYIKKEAKGHQYTYATESQILGAIREKMDELQVLMYQDMVAIERSDKGTLLTFKYTWVNAEIPEEKIECTQYMSEPKFDAKAIGSMMTYGNKYFLYKFLNVPTDKDDPDAFQAKADARKPKPCLSKEQIEKLLYIIGGRKDIYDEILQTYGVADLGLIAADQYQTLENGIKTRLGNEGKN